MTPLRLRVVHAFVAAVMILALSANVAAADDTSIDSVPYDPGLPCEILSAPGPSSPITE